MVRHRPCLALPTALIQPRPLVGQEPEDVRNVDPPPRAHPWTESFYVLEGKLMVTVDDKQTLAAAGTSVLVPAGAVHTFRVASPQARSITTTSGDKPSVFFRDLASTAPGLPHDETMPLVLEVAKRNRLTSLLFD
jgi:Cupin domain